MTPTKKDAEEVPPAKEVKEKERPKEKPKAKEPRPRQLEHDEKEEAIAKKRLLKKKSDYPTFNDIESDWYSEKEKKKEKAGKEDTKNTQEE